VKPQFQMPRDMSGYSDLEAAMLHAIHAARLPEPVAEYRFHETRRWRFDFAWPALRVALECEGGTWSGGRHTRGDGFERDAEKYSEAAIQGWLVVRVTGAQVEDGRALETLERALAARQEATGAS